MIAALLIFQKLFHIFTQYFDNIYMQFNQRQIKQIEVSTKQLLQSAPYRKMMQLDDGLYTLCLLNQNSFQKPFISAEKAKNQWLKSITAAFNFQILYAELVNIQRKNKSVSRDKRCQNNLILYEMIRKNLEKPQQQYHIYNFQQLEQQYEYRTFYNENEELHSTKKELYLMQSNQDTAHAPLNIFCIKEGSIDAVDLIITIDGIKAYQTMNQLELKLQLQAINGDISYEYSDQQQKIITKIFIASNKEHDLLNNLLHLYSSPLRDFLLFKDLQHPQSFSINQPNQLESNQQPIDPSPSKKILAQSELIKYFQEAEEMLFNKANDFISLKSTQDHLCEKIKQVLQSAKNNLCEQDLMLRLQRIIRILEFRKIKMDVRIESSYELNLFQIVYEGMTELIQQACLILNIAKLEKDVSLRRLDTSNERAIEDELERLQQNYGFKSSTANILDKLFINYIREKARKGEPQRMFVSFQNGKKSQLKVFLAGLINHTKYPQMWRDIFSKAERAVIFAKLSLAAKTKNTQSQIIHKQPSQKLPFSSQQKLGSINQNNSHCIGCYKYFTMNENIVIPKQISVIYHDNIKNIMGEQKQLMNQICELLNQNGGFILFNLEVVLTKIFCKGAFINQMERLEYAQFIQKVFSKIKPTPQKNKDYVISFVPINEELPEFGKKNWKEFEQETKKGQYYLQNKKIEGLFVTRIKVSPQTQIKYSQLQQISQKKEPLELNPFVPTPRKLLLHTCNPIQQITRQIDVQLPNYHILIIKPINLSDLVKQMHHLQMRFQFMNRFRNHQFPIMRFVAVVQHAQLNEYIMQHISTIIYEEKHVLCIEVNFFIKLLPDGALENTVMRDVANAFLQEFPREKLFYYKFDVQDRNEYYLRTESKLATIFLYFLFSSLYIKAIIKDPESIESLQLLKQIEAEKDQQ